MYPSADMDPEPSFPMKVVSRRTGLTPHIIRVWERRYRAVTPKRTETNRRLYSNEDIERLKLLRQATQAGHSIGQVAQLSTETLATLVESDRRAEAAAPAQGIDANSDGDVGLTAESLLANAVEAVKQIDCERLEATLESAHVALSHPDLIDRLLAPLLVEIGNLWQSGMIKVAHEHPASAVVRTFLGNLKAEMRVGANAPLLVSATPVGQRHELGALMASVTAAAMGWRVIFLGPDLPADEIAAAASRKGARAVGLSFVYPPDDPRISSQLRKLRRALPPDISIVAGGKGADSYADTLDSIGALRLTDMPSFRRVLEGLRNDSRMPS